MRVLVCGGRDFDDASWLYSVLEELTEQQGIDTIIHGAATDADTLASCWGLDFAAQVIAYPADWEKHGQAAGPIRNQQMLDEGKPDLIVVFPGGLGTADMIRRAQAAGVRVLLPERGTET